jgi:hypothetical protein
MGARCRAIFGYGFESTNIVLQWPSAMANDDALKRLRPAPASVYLLAEHLDAALAAGEDLTGVLCLSSDTPPREEAELV